MAKLALLVGIDAYPASPLAGCVNDATRMAELLSRHADGKPNFECKKLTALSAPYDTVTRASLKQEVKDLFGRQADVALFFFAGHGTANNLGGYLVTQDAKQYDEGLSMIDVLTLANTSPAKERIIILDCCHSGAMGNLPAINNDQAMITEGVTVLSASRGDEGAMEQGGGGLFTSLVCDALKGGAADVCGKVTTAGVYAYVDEALGGWDQRPLYKIHVSELMPLRYCPPAVDPEILRLLPVYFTSPAYEFPLDPTYEPCEPSHVLENTKIFGHLQKMRAARLVEPVGEEHLYFAAIYSKSCRLTPLGIHYWSLAQKREDMTTRVGVTGHQRLDDPRAWTWVEYAMGKALDTLEPPLVAISSLAIGADQLLAALVLGRGGELLAVIPFQEYERTFGPEDVETYRRILAKGLTVEYLTTEGTDEDKYLAAGKRIVELADVIIAVWDGKPAKGKGGTADIVLHALQEGVRLIHINPMDHSITPSLETTPHTVKAVS